jgi:UDP-N-acetylmuramoyl-L-alanyl-D-glutamate--2,6-diaminopimelate ligase
LYGNLAVGALTTPDALRVHQVLASCRAHGARYTVMEVSSHGLEQERLAGVEFATAVFTNLTRDHLDYHGDMDAYANAKKRLFEHPSVRHAVINTRDPYGRTLVDAVPHTAEVLTYALVDAAPAQGATPEAMVVGWLEARTREGLVMQVQSPWGWGRVDAPLLGRFNAENLLATLATLLLSGVPIERATEMLCHATALPGRMECICVEGSPMVVVDYAHTPDALARALVELRAHCAGTLWCVFGCGGERDAGKRPQMGAIAAKHADRVVLTDDNPRCEDGQRIIEDVLEGVESQDTLCVQRDREQAIRLAIADAGAEDVVLVAGKGHEPYQEIGGVRHRFSDVTTVLRILNGEPR